MSEGQGGKPYGSIGLVRPKVSLLLAGIGSLALAPVVIASALTLGFYPLLVHIVTVGVIGAVTLRRAFLSTNGAKVVRDRLTIGANEIRFGGRLLARRADIVQGFLVPVENGLLVRLERRGMRPPIFLSVRDEETGLALLRELGLDAEHVTAEMRIASALHAMSLRAQAWFVALPFFASFLATATVIPLLGSAAPYVTVGLLLVLVAYSLGLALAPTTVRIGTDGILTRWLGRRRFIPFTQITSTGVYEETVASKQWHGVRLVLRGGELVKLPAGQTEIGAAEARRLWRRIEDARAARAAGARAVDVLARGQRSFVEWVRDLRRMGAGAQGHRTAAVPTDILLRVVEDGAASAVDRASAAVAVLAAADPEAKRRVRVAADTTASPKLRVALTRIAESSGTDDDAEVAAALEQLGDERKKAVR